MTLAVVAAVACATPASAVVTSNVAGTVLNVSSDAGDPINIACNGASNVAVNGVQVGGGHLCSSITNINVNGGPAANVIDLSGVTTDTFTQPGLAVVINGFGGNDTITGSQVGDFINGDDGDDTIVGGRGNDTISGLAGNDTMTWNPGDGSDLNNGGTGDDRTVVNGGNADETFTIKPEGAANVRFDRTSAPQFGIDITQTEHLRLNANGGNDRVDGATDLAGRILLELNGGDGDDTINGGDGADTINGNAGNDTLAGARGNDTVNGNDGDDVMTWNPGDGSDVNEGGNGFDRSVVNGGANDEQFTAAPNGNRVKFDRVNPNPFNVDIGTTEILQLNAGDGNDTFATADGLAPLIAVVASGDGGNDAITGSNAPEIFNGGPGNDTLIGGPASDALDGGPGIDVLLARDGEVDSVTCDNPSDTFQVDPIDILNGCVAAVPPTPPAPPGPPPVNPPSGGTPPPPPNQVVTGPRVTISGTTRLRRGRVSVRLTCPRNARGRCVVRLTLRRGRVTLGTARTTINRGRAKSVSVRINRRGLRLLRQRRTTTVRAIINATDNNRVNAQRNVALRIRR